MKLIFFAYYCFKYLIVWKFFTVPFSSVFFLGREGHSLIQSGFQTFLSTTRNFPLWYSETQFPCDYSLYEGPTKFVVFLWNKHWEKLAVNFSWLLSHMIWNFDQRTHYLFVSLFIFVLFISTELLDPLCSWNYGHYYIGRCINTPWETSSEIGPENFLFLIVFLVILDSH